MAQSLDSKRYGRKTKLQDVQQTLARHGVNATNQEHRINLNKKDLKSYSLLSPSLSIVISLEWF